MLFMLASMPVALMMEDLMERRVTYAGTSLSSSSARTCLSTRGSSAMSSASLARRGPRPPSSSSTMHSCFWKSAHSSSAVLEAAASQQGRRCRPCAVGRRSRAQKQGATRWAAQQESRNGHRRLRRRHGHALAARAELLYEALAQAGHALRQRARVLARAALRGARSAPHLVLGSDKGLALQKCRAVGARRGPRELRERRARRHCGLCALCGRASARTAARRDKGAQRAAYSLCPCSRQATRDKNLNGGIGGGIKSRAKHARARRAAKGRGAGRSRRPPAPSQWPLQGGASRAQRTSRGGKRG